MVNAGPAALSIKGLRKVYRGGLTAVSRLDLELTDGAFFGLLGPNGAGKTTLDHVYAMESIILLPLGFLGGIFYSVGQLPYVWDVVSQINPVFWLVQVERIGLLGHGDVSAVSALAVVWALALALSVWSAVIFGANRLKA